MGSQVTGLGLGGPMAVLERAREVEKAGEQDTPQKIAAGDMYP